MLDWRTGSDRGDVPGPRRKTIYGPDGELRGMMSTTEDALLVVRALRALKRLEGLSLPVCDRWDVGAWSACGKCTACRVHAILTAKEGS